MKQFFRMVAGVLVLPVAVVLSLALYTQNTIPDKLYVTQGQPLSIASPFPLYANAQNTMVPIESYASVGNSYDMNLRMFGAVGVKQVQVQVVEEKLVVPAGIPFGIKMFTEGVIVVGMSDIDSGRGMINPAKLSGVQIGDILLTVSGSKVESNEQLGEVVRRSEGKPVKVSLRRGEQMFEKTLTPVKSAADDQYKAGIWVRDSSAGIGTMTYLDPKTGCYAGLGHAVCDVDTQLVMPLYSGEIVRANIRGVQSGTSGMPGELKGVFLENAPMGSLLINSETGVFGQLFRSRSLHDPVPIAQSHEVERGPATILSTISGEEPQEFNIQIDKINSTTPGDTKNMVISVTDPDLLLKTGGIVQGMSGSPILQNGKLVGAVTHVFVNDPTRGFAIFVENMDNTMKGVLSLSEVAS